MDSTWYGFTLTAVKTLSSFIFNTLGYCLWATYYYLGFKFNLNIFYFQFLSGSGHGGVVTDTHVYSFTGSNILSGGKNEETAGPGAGSGALTSSQVISRTSSLGFETSS